MIIKRHKAVTYDHTFLFSAREAKEFLQYANSKREQTQDPLTQIVSISVLCIGDRDDVRQSVHMNAAVRTKSGISR